MNQSTIVEEFTYWKSTTAIIVISQLLVSFSVGLIVNLLIIVTIFKTKSLRAPLNVIHLSLLFLNCLLSVPDVITCGIFIPALLRYCECSQLITLVYFTVDVIYILYFPLNLSFLGLFQLLIIKGKKRLVTYKSTIGTVITSFVITTLLTSVGILLLNSGGQTYICIDTCPGYSTYNFDGIALGFVIYLVTCFIPCLLVVTLCTIWSCAIFKKNYIGGNDDLNRRMLSLPFVLPLILIIPTVISVPLVRYARQLLISFRPTDYPYWTIFVRFIAFQIYEFIAKIGYPLILLALNPKLGNNCKTFVFTMTKCLRRNNQVGPIQ